MAQNSRSLRVRIASWLVLTTVQVACGGGRNQSGRQAALEGSRLDSTVLAAVASARSQSASALNADWLDLTADSSRVVPRLVYVRGVYKPPGSAHAETIVNVAIRDDHQRILNSTADFATIAAGWAPVSAREAVLACSELVGVLGAGSRSSSRSIVFERADDWRKLGFDPPGPPWRNRVAAPRVKVPRGGWQVTLWAAVPGRLIEYQCTLIAGRPALLQPVDSIPHAGLMPDTP